MAISIVSMQSGSQSYGTGGTGTGTVSFSAAAGDIIVFAYTYDAGTSTTWTGSQYLGGSSQTSISAGYYPGFSAIYRTYASATSDSLTITPSYGSSASSWFLFKITGADLTTPFLQQKGVNSNSTGTVPLSAFASPQNRCLMITQGVSPPAGYTYVGASPSVYWDSADNNSYGTAYVSSYQDLFVAEINASVPMVSANFTKTPSTSTVVSDSTKVAWTNPNGMVVYDSSYASVGSLGISSVSQIVMVGGFGWSIPAGATIKSMVIYLERYAVFDAVDGGSNVFDDTIQLVVNSGGTKTLFGTNYASTTAWPSKSGEGFQTYSFSTNLPTPAQINDPLFGVAIACKASGGYNALTTTGYVDSVQLNISYQYAADVFNQTRMFLMF